MSKKTPTKAQAKILAWAIHRAGGRMLALDWCDVLTISDATVAAMVRDGWAERAMFFDEIKRWRWSLFYVTDAAREAPAVVSEVAGLMALSEANARRWNEEDDAP